MYTNVIENQFSTSANDCHPASANETCTSASPIGASRFIPFLTVLQMYHIAIPAATPGADVAALANRVSMRISRGALLPVLWPPALNSIVSLNLFFIGSTGLFSRVVDCEVARW